MKQLINLHQMSNDSHGILQIDTINDRDIIILICPGGGYNHLSTRESDPVAIKFQSLGYNTAILRYSISPYIYPTFIDEINTSIKYLYSNFKNIILLGFSAGGHLVGIGSTDKYSKYVKASIYCYTVFSLENYINKGTSECFLGKDDSKENRHIYSIENRINKDTPPCFVWTTKDDEAVPCQNSMQFVDALKKNNIKHEFIMFNHGRHGSALADETAIKDGDTSYVNKDVAIWPTLVDKFIKKVINE